MGNILFLSMGPGITALDLELSCKKEGFKIYGPLNSPAQINNILSKRKLDYIIHDTDFIPVDVVLPKLLSLNTPVIFIGSAPHNPDAQKYPQIIKYIRKPFMCSSILNCLTKSTI